MKKMKLVWSLIIAFVAVSTQAQVKEAVNPETAPIMTFEKTVADWGTLKEGEKFNTDFKFTNTGKTDLIITRIKGNCGCTIPSNWKKEPIKPGETSLFHVTFNSRNKPNRQQKIITVYCNTVKGRETVKIKGMVTPDPEMAKMREERAAKRREMYAKRKAERERLAKEKANKSNQIAVISKEQKEINEKKALEKKRIKSDKAISLKARKSDKELKRSKKEHEEKLAMAKKDQKLKEKSIKTQEKEIKNRKEISKKEQKLAEKRIKADEKKLKAAEKARKEAEKKAKKAEKKAKKLEKEAKKKAKIQERVSKASDKLAKEESKLTKMQAKFKRLEMKGKLSPNDVTKKKLAMEKQIEKINDAKAKLAKVKRKL